MIKCSDYRKLPGDLSVFLSGFGRRGGVTWESLPLWIRLTVDFEVSGCMSMFLLSYHVSNVSNMLLALMILIYVIGYFLN